MTDAIVVTAEFRLKPGYVDEWLRLMLDHYGPACVGEQGMLRYEQWADRADFDASLRAAWREDYHVDTERLWDRPRVMTVYRRIPTEWEPLNDDGLPLSLRD